MRNAGRAERVEGETSQAGAANATVVGKRERKDTRSGSSGYVVRRRKSAPGSRSKRPRQRLGRMYEVANKVYREDLTPSNLRLEAMIVQQDECR